MIRYSIVIPHRNSPLLLERCLDTIPQRDDLEVIVVDDNSEENKKPKIDRNDVSLIFLSKDQAKGAGHARNVGLAKARGKWLLFADADDFYVKGFLECLDAYSASNSDIIYFNTYFVTGDAPYNYSINDYWEHSVLRYMNSKKTTKDRLRLTMSVNYPWNKMFSHAFVIEKGVMFEEIPICNDAYFSIKLGSMAEKVDIISDRLYCYMNNSSGITKRQRPFSDYCVEIKAINHINRIYFKAGLIDLISLPGFNKSNVLRDYGRMAFISLYCYKILHDPTFVPVFVFHVFRKLKNTLKGIRICICLL